MSLLVTAMVDKLGQCVNIVVVCGIHQISLLIDDGQSQCCTTCKYCTRKSEQAFFIINSTRALTRADKAMQQTSPTLYTPRAQQGKEVKLAFFCWQMCTVPSCVSIYPVGISVWFLILSFVVLLYYGSFYGCWCLRISQCAMILLHQRQYAADIAESTGDEINVVFLISLKLCKTYTVYGFCVKTLHHENRGCLDQNKYILKVTSDLFSVELPQFELGFENGYS